MDRFLFALSLGLAALILAPRPAAAGPQCAAHDVVAQHLSDEFAETSRSIGLSTNNTVMELFASDQTGTWTLIVTLPNGLTCLMAAGDNFETVTAPQVAAGDPA